MSVKAVIYDIGNVLIEWQPERHYDATIGEARRRALFAAVDLHGMNDAIDKGAPFRKTIYDAADANPEFRAEIRDWFDSWHRMAAPAIPLSIHLLRTLRAKGVPVFALSNFGVESFAFAETIYGFLGDFDRRYISGHMKEVKPHAPIYEMVEADCGIAPENLLFVDDRSDNIAMAKSRGWQTHQFVTAEAWGECLVSHGLLTANDTQMPI